MKDLKLATVKIDDDAFILLNNCETHSVDGWYNSYYNSITRVEWSYNNYFRNWPNFAVFEVEDLYYYHVSLKFYIRPRPRPLSEPKLREPKPLVFKINRTF